MPVATDPLLEDLRAATLGEYEVYGELGRGGMAAVYLAHEIALDRKVAIKVMLPELLSGAGMAERFRREARTAGALSHPHIIPIFSVKESEGMLYFVMKFVEGRGLDSIIGELGPLPLRMVQAIVSQVAGALAHAHRKNVIHRDIKPANVMIDEDGWAVVADFGIAKVRDAAALTTTGAAIGTPYYMSPEQGSGKTVTGASDQYSLGIMAYEMLTGAPPFTGPSVMEVMSGHFFEPPGPLRGKRSDCPESLEAVVLRMLAKAAQDRFSTLEDVIAAIAAPPLAHDDPVRTQMVTLAKSGARTRPRMSVPASPVPLARRTKPARPAALGATTVPLSPWERLRRRPALAVVGLLVLAAVGAVAVVASMRDTAPSAATAASAERAAGPTQAPPPSTTLQAVPPPRVLPESVQAAPATPQRRDARVAAPAPELAKRDLARRDQSRRDADPQARRDSLERARRDSIAQARYDSMIRARAADSLVRVQAQRDSTVRAQRAAVPPETARAAPAVPDTGFVVFGTRAPGAAYYVDNAARGVISGLRTLTLRTGPHRLAINAEGCTAWDSSVTVRGGETVRLGYRSPRCP